MELDVIISGFGGQGVLFAGTALTYSAVMENKHSTWMPAYGAEMRGGTANCTVVISDEEIASPYIVNPSNVIALNTPSVKKFENQIKSGGTMIINSSLVNEKPSRDDINYVFIPVTEIANELGEPKCANIVALGAFIEKTRIISLESAKMAIAKALPSHRKGLILLNTQALEKGAEFVKKSKQLANCC